MKMMKYSLFAGAVLFCAANLAAAPAQKSAPVKSQTPQIIREAQNASRSRDLAKTLAAYEKVFAQTDLTASDRVNAYISIANVMLGQKKPMVAEAFAELDKALAVSGITPADRQKILFAKAEKRFRDNFPQGGFGAYFEDGILDALKFYREAAAIPGLTNLQKIECAKRIANCLLELMKVDEANAVLAQVAAMPGLTPEEAFRANWNLADAYRRELEMDKAIPVYEKVLSYEKIHVNDRNQIIGVIARHLLSSQGLAAAEAYLDKQPGGERIREWIKRDAGDTKFFIDANFSMLNNKDLKAGERAKALRALIDQGIRSKDLALLQKCEPFAEPIFKEEPRERNMYSQIFTSFAVKRDLANHPELMMYGAQRILAFAPDDLAANEMLAENAFRAGRPEVSKAAIEVLVKQASLAPAKKIQYGAMLLVMNANGKPDGVAKKILDLVKASTDDKLKTPAETAKTLQQAAQFAMRIKAFEVGKAIWAAREAMLVPEPKRSLVCAFLENGPKDISGFIASDYVKNAANRGTLDRKFGDNLQFILDTDAAMTGRKVTADDGKAAKPTQFTVSCDEDGVKFFFLMPCDPERAKNLKSGFGSFGGFETYLATGYDQPYHCYLIDAPPTNYMGDDFPTQYNNKNFRRSMQKDGNLKLSFQIGNDMVYALLEFDWKTVMNGIPRNGDKWEFEPIHWERGGWSWGGSKSVHNRSSFGEIVFSGMTDAHRTAIQRRLLSFAASAYRKELSSKNGCIEQWMDPELGDLKFNAEVMEPFKKKYGAYLDRIKAEMTDADVKEIFNDAYSVLINTKYVVSELRRNWLEKQFVEE